MLATFLLTTLAVPGAALPQQAVDFERDIRPILEESCFRCHGPHAKRIRGHLMMAGTNSLLEGGDSGPAIVPGDPDRSLLIRMVRYEGEDMEMPPKAPLAANQVALLERWVLEGAVWPGGDDAATDTREISMEEGRQWWAFQPVTRPTVPPPMGSLAGAQSDNPIDRFISQRLEQAGLKAAPAADERTLVRRLYVDLLGLQPSFEEVERYQNDEREHKWSLLIDELLGRAQYGERWGRHWLDVVHFAQTNGYELDQEKQYIWRYRDYVIDTFNSDKPYDLFLREQLAGDELEEVSSESLIATGFYSLGMWDTEPNDKEQAVWDSQDDILRTITEGMMAVTVGCARCHDHRFDPVRQKDYYSLIAFLRNVEPYKKPQYNLDSRTHRVPNADSSTRDSWERARTAQVANLKEASTALYDKHLASFIDARYDALLKARLTEARFNREEYTLHELAKKLRVRHTDVTQALPVQERVDLYLLTDKLKSLEKSFDGDLPWTMCVSESGTTPVTTHVLRRGKVSSPLDQVSAGFLPVLCADDASAIPEFQPNLVPEDMSRSTSGQRLALANWIASPEHPTTARVMVNRIWQGHFGQGLVSTPNDFGATGEVPSHPLLLDWLAAEFVSNGWSVKHLHRIILNSSTYRRSSSFETPEAMISDPGNRLLWRQNMRRLDAESLHDSILAVCGSLNMESGGRGFFPSLSLEAMAGGSRPGGGWEPSTEEQRNRRAIYAYVKRSMLVPFFTVFDSLDPSFSQGKRASTTVASQALTLLNGAFANRSALEMARELQAQHADDLPALARAVYQRIMLREPTERELEVITQLLRDQVSGFEALPPRLTFRAAVPGRLAIPFLRLLQGEHCLSGPREAWDYFTGWWGNAYNMTQEALADHGPFALLREPEFTNGRITFDMTLEKGSDSVGVLLRARPQGSYAQGLQVSFDVVNQEVRLQILNTKSPEPVVLLRVPCPLTTEVRHQVAIRIYSGELIVALDGKQIVEYPADEDSHALTSGSGRFGLQTTGAAVHLENLTVSSDSVVTRVTPDAPGPPLERALALLCLTAMNLNEFLYVD